MKRGRAPGAFIATWRTRRGILHSSSQHSLAPVHTWHTRLPVISKLALRSSCRDSISTDFIRSGHQVSLRESTSRRQHRLLVVLDIRSILGSGRSVNIVRPPLNLGSSCSPLISRLGGESSNLPTQEPSENDSHNKSEDNDSNDNSKSDVKDDIGSDATDADRINESYADGIDQTGGHGSLITSNYQCCNITPSIAGVSILDLVEDTRVRNLTDVEPIQ